MEGEELELRGEGYLGIVSNQEKRRLGEKGSGEHGKRGRGNVAPIVPEEGYSLDLAKNQCTGRRA